MANEINSLYYLRFLSDFWIRFYKNQSLVLEGALSATAEMVKSFYFSFLQRQLPTSISEFPIFQEQFWNVLVFKDSERVAVDINLKPTTDENKIKFVRYPLDEAYVNIPFLYNVVFEPTLFLSQGVYKEFITELKPNTNNTLIVGYDYINEYNGIINCGSVEINPGETFVAKSDKYTLSSIDLIGNVRRNHDYFLQTIRTDTDTDELQLLLLSYIYFPKEQDIYLNSKIAQRVLTNENAIEITLFAPKAYLDYQELFKMYGAIIGVSAKSSIEYKNFIDGILKLYQTGPMVVPMNIALNVANGYPVSREEEIIIKLKIEEYFFVLTSNKGNEYKIKRLIVEEVYVDPLLDDIVRKKIALPRLTISNPYYYLKKLRKQLKETNVNVLPSVQDVLNNNYSLVNPFTLQINPFRDFTNIESFTVGATYDVYWEVDQMEGFVDQLKVVDYKTQEKWWLDKIASSKVLETIISATETTRSDITVIDYLFENILKYNTFGIFVDSRITTNFQGITDFIKIVNQVKPTYKTFLVNEQNLNTYSDIEEPDAEQAAVTPYIPLETNYNFVPKIGMNMLGLDKENPYSLEKVIRLGQKLEDIGSAYLDLYWTITFKSQLDELNNPTKNSIYSSYSPTFSQRLVVGAPNLYMGKNYDEGTYDQCDFYVLTMPDDLVALTATNIDVTSFTANWEISTAVDVEYLISLAYDEEMTNLVEGYESISVDPNFNFYNFTGLDFYSSYYYQVSGVNSNTWPIGSSNVINLQTLPYPAPVALSASNITYQSATLNWDNYEYTNKFKLDVSSDNFLTFFPGYEDKDITGTYEEITGLDSETSYQYRVRANIDYEPYVTENSNVIELETAIAPPIPLAATNIWENGFVANWQTVAGAINYRLDVSEDNFVTFLPGYEDKILINNYEEITGLEENKSYKYRVRVDKGEISVNSATITVITSDYTLLYLFTESTGSSVQDYSITPTNPATIQPNLLEPNVMIYFPFAETSLSSVESYSEIINNGTINNIPEPPDANIIIEYEFTESAGINVNDNSPFGYDNDATVNEQPAAIDPNIIIEYKFTESAGTNVNDNSPAGYNNDALIDEGA